MAKQKYYLGKGASGVMPFDRLYAITHFIMPNFGTMDWHGNTREEINDNIKRLQVDEGALFDKIMLYIHVPYCKSFCHYCNFNRSHYPRQGEDKLDLYVEYLIRELSAYLAMPYIQARTFTAIYIGGGSPSTLSAPAMEKLFTFLKEHVPDYDRLEKTFTGEPRTLHAIEKLRLLKEFGFERVTFGVETFNEDIHRAIGRADTRADVDAVFENMDRINYQADRCVDLMYDLPGQTLDTFMQDLDTLVNEYAPDEADLFGTVYLPYRPMHKMILMEKLPQPGNSQQLLQMREYGYDYMLDNGYHNTIAETFSRHTRRTEYQTAHCARQDIIGVGCAARGNLQDMVSINPEKLEDWMANIDQWGISTETLQPIGRSGVLDRIAVMFPRYGELDKALVDSFDDTERYPYVMSILQQHIEAGCVEELDDRYVTNKLGVLWHGNLQTDLMRHTLNKQGLTLLDLISEPVEQFDRPVRFQMDPQTRFILDNPELYPLLMK